MSEFKQINHPVITEHSHVTLHYRITVLDDLLTDFLNTFDGNPATVAIGQAQLAPFMEERLVGLEEGAHETFDLTAKEAFGEYNSALRQEVGRSLLLEGNPHVDEFDKGDFVDFSMPNGYRMTGMFQGWNNEKTGAWVDFNHPLAGKSLRLELKVIGVL